MFYGVRAVGAGVVAQPPSDPPNERNHRVNDRLRNAEHAPNRKWSLSRRRIEELPIDA